MANEPEVERKVAAALADALIADPFYAAITIDFAGDEIRRRAVLAVYCRYSLLEGYHIGKVVVPDGEPYGAAIWTLPQPPDVAERARQAKHSAFAALLGPRGLANYRAILDFMEPAAQAVIAPDTWYLSILGVTPQRQGRGLGRALLTPTLREADRAEARCFLETFNAVA
ncbi:MAG: GNAT family N-acetyltransferase [Anaerolineae bacterium]